MKTRAMSALAAMFLVAACQKSTPTPVPAPDGSMSDDVVTPADTDVSNADTLQAPDVVTEVLSDADVAQQVVDTDTSTEVADIVDAADALPAVDTGPETDTSPGPDAIYIADAGSPTCADKYGPMPMPGQPCSKLGEVRCSDFGAVAGGPFIGVGTVCARPNRVVCGTAPSGPQVWLELPCEPVSDACKVGPKLAICVEYGKEAVCVPASEEFKFRPCLDNQVGQFDCVATGTDSMYSCRKPSEPAGDYITNQIVKSEYAWLKTCCPDCRFWLPWQLCPKVNVCDCKEVPLQNCPNGASDRHACIENLNGGAPGCATNCTEIQQWSGWDEGF